MNKNGFTLIEILAVLALVSIVMILIIPNIINIFSDTKKELFRDEVINIYTNSYSTYINRSASNEDYSKRFCVGSDIALNRLELEEKDGLYYDIIVNNYGEVLSLKVTNENYSLSLSNDKGVRKKEITIDNITDKIDIKCQ